MEKAVRIAYWINAILIFALFSLGMLRASMDQGDWLLFIGIAGVFLFPFLEAPMFVISIWGIVKDRQRRLLYIITALLMTSGLLFAFVNRDMPLP